MRYSALTQRIDGDGAAAWRIHDRALTLREQGADVLLLSVGDSDFDTPQPIVQACIDSLLAGDTHYGRRAAVPGCDAVSRSVIDVSVVRWWALIR